MEAANRPKTDGISKSYHVPALEKGLHILEYLCQNPEGKSFADIIAKLGISRTTTFSILRNLMDSAYVRKSADGNYHASLKIYSLGMGLVQQLNKAELLLPDLTALREELGYTVHAVVYANRESIVIEKLDGDSAIVFKSYIGERKPLHLSGGGKAIMSYLPGNEFDLYAKGELERLTENSLCTKEQLVECRRQVRADGFSTDNEEGEPGVFCLGAPLFSAGGVLLGAISISTLKIFIDAEKLSACSRRIIQAGADISRKMGYTGEYPLK